jgi:hypothetical protein
VSSVAAGVALATLYTVSPLALCAFAFALIAVVLARRGLSDGQSRLLTAILGVALAVRLAAVAGIFIASMPIHDDQFVGALTGDGAYSMTRALRSRDLVFGIPANKYDYVVAFDEYGRNSWVSLLTATQIAFGPAPYGVRLINSVLFVSGALILFRVTRDALGPAPAMAGLATLLFLPTLFVWSISLLKESLYFAGTALIFWATVTMLRARGWTARFWAVMAGLAGAFAIHDLRSGAVWLAMLGLATGLAMRAATASRRIFTGAAVAVVLAAAVLLSRAPIQARAIQALESTAKTHTGHVFTVGHAYKLLDQGFYFNPQAPAASTLTLTPGQSARYLLRALASFAVVPAPWQLASTRELAFLPEQLLWYIMLLLLPVGAVAGWRRDPLVTCLLLGYAAPTCGVLALTNGNVGTLLRLRGLVTPYLVWMSAAGFCATLQLLTRHRSGAGS